MPTKTYTNRDALDAPRRPGGPSRTTQTPGPSLADLVKAATVDPYGDGYQNTSERDSILADALAGLERANKYQTTSPESEAEADTLLHSGVNAEVSRLNRDARMPGQITDAMKVGAGLGFPAIAEHAPKTALAGELLSLPFTWPQQAATSAVSGMRKIGVPSEGESRADGAVELVGAGLQTPYPYRAIGGLINAAKGSYRTMQQGSFPSRVLGGTASEEIPYASRQVAEDPNQILSVARDIAAENGEPVGDVLNTRASSKAGYGKERVEALKGLERSGDRYRLSQTGEQNIRTNPQTGEVWAGDSPKKAPFTHEGFLDDMRSIVGDGEIPIELPRSRTVPQLRAFERFGRTYRTE